MTNESDESDTVEGLDLISSVKLVQVTEACIRLKN